MKNIFKGKKKNVDPPKEEIKAVDPPKAALEENASVEPNEEENAASNKSFSYGSTFDELSKVPEVKDETQKELSKLVRKQKVSYGEILKARQGERKSKAFARRSKGD